MSKTKVLILGKLPPPYMGPSIATEILLKSDLKNRFELIHLDTKINHSISSFGKWNFTKISKNINQNFSASHRIKCAIPAIQAHASFCAPFVFTPEFVQYKTNCHKRPKSVKNRFNCMCKPVHTENHLLRPYHV